MCHIGSRLRAPSVPASAASRRAREHAWAAVSVRGRVRIWSRKVEWRGPQSRLRKYWSRCRRDEKFHRTGIKCPRRRERWRDAWLWNPSSVSRLGTEKDSARVIEARCLRSYDCRGDEINRIRFFDHLNVLNVCNREGNAWLIRFLFCICKLIDFALSNIEVLISHMRLYLSFCRNYFSSYFLLSDLDYLNFI